MKFFEENEPILFMSNDKSTKQQIEDGLNRNLITIQTIDSFLEESDKALKLFKRVNIIFVDNMPKEIKMYVENVGKALEAIAKLKSCELMTIEIGISTHLFKSVNSFRFAKTIDFIEYAQYSRRNVEIENLEKSENKEDVEFSNQYRMLLVENEGRKEKVKLMIKQINEIQEKLLEKETKISNLENEINSIYSVEKENAIKKLYKLEDDFKEIKRQRDAEIEKNKEFELELNKFRSENVDYKTQIKSYKSLIIDYKDEQEKLRNEIKSLIEALKQERKDKSELIKSRVNADDVYHLNTSLTEERNKVLRLKEENDSLEVKIKKLELTVSEYEMDIEALRAGKEELKVYGRTNKLDTCELDYTGVIYFKIIKDLPYLNSSLKELIDILKNEGKKVHVMILKNDEGLDSKKYSKYKIYGSLGDVRSEYPIYRIYPSPNMFKNYQNYEEKCDVVIVLDYIQSSDYYITSKAFYKVFTVVNKAEDITKYSLDGQAITLGKGSVLNIDYDEKIRQATLESTKRKLIKNKVDYWYNQYLI